MICLWENLCADNPLSSLCLCYAMSFARSLLQLLALPSTTQGLCFFHKGNAVKLSSCSAVQSDLFARGQKIMVLSDRSLCCSAQAKSNRTLSEYFQPAKGPSSPPSSDTQVFKAVLPSRGSLQILQNRADLLAFVIPPSTPGAWVLSSPPQLSKVRCSCTSKLCSTTD